MNRFLIAAALSTVFQMHPGKAHAAEPVSAFGPASFKQIVAERQGKPFVILVWSLDCAYCAPSFEALADMKTKHGLEVVTVATDPATDAEAVRLISKRLSAYRLTDNAWAFGAYPEEQLRHAIDPKWRGELPRAYWFRRDGTVTAHSGLVTKEAASRHIGK